MSNVWNKLRKIHPKKQKTQQKKFNQLRMVFPPKQLRVNARPVRNQFIHTNHSVVSCGIYRVFSCQLVQDFFPKTKHGHVWREIETPCPKHHFVSFCHVLSMLHVFFVDARIPFLWRLVEKTSKKHPQPYRVGSYWLWMELKPILVALQMEL